MGERGVPREELRAVRGGRVVLMRGARGGRGGVGSGEGRGREGRGETGVP